MVSWRFVWWFRRFCGGLEGLWWFRGFCGGLEGLWWFRGFVVV